MAAVRTSNYSRTRTQLKVLRGPENVEKDVVTEVRQLTEILNTPGGRIVTMLSMIVAGLLTKTELLTNSACFALLLFLGRTARRQKAESIGPLLLALLKRKSSG
jgi:hypothetical protein